MSPFMSIVCPAQGPICTPASRYSSNTFSLNSPPAYLLGNFQKIDSPTPLSCSSTQVLIWCLPTVNAFVAQRGALSSPCSEDPHEEHCLVEDDTSPRPHRTNVPPTPGARGSYSRPSRLTALKAHRFSHMHGQMHIMTVVLAVESVVQLESFPSLTRWWRLVSY